MLCHHGTDLVGSQLTRLSAAELFKSFFFFRINGSDHLWPPSFVSLYLMRYQNLSYWFSALKKVKKKSFTQSGVSRNELRFVLFCPEDHMYKIIEDSLKHAEKKNHFSEHQTLSL